MRAVKNVESARLSCVGAASLLDQITLGEAARLSETLRRISKIIPIDFENEDRISNTFKDPPFGKCPPCCFYSGFEGAEI